LGAVLGMDVGTVDPQLDANRNGAIQ
jgi:hypothetical protein